MTKYEELVDKICQRDDIELVRERSDHPLTVALPGEDDGPDYIFFHEKLYGTDAERRVALAHEQAHCDTRTFYTLSTPFDTKGRREYRAKRRAVLELIPYELLVEAVAACRFSEYVTDYDMAEYLDVTPEFVMFSVETYRRKGYYLM